MTDLYFHDETSKTIIKASQTRISITTSDSSTGLIKSDTDGLQSTSLSRSLESEALADSSVMIPQTILQSQEEHALCFFFSEYILTSRHPEASQGYLGYLEKFYTNAKRDSPITAATSAIALAAFSAIPGKRELRLQARRQYGEAVSRLKLAISDPVQARSDGTLISVLLFGLFESLTCNVQSLANWGKHNDGAVALVKARGDSIFENPVSRQLFFVTRDQTVLNHISRCEPIDLSPGATGAWIITSENLTDNAANRLVALAVKLPSVRAAALRIFGLPINMETAGEVLQLMNISKLIDEKFAAWEASVPESWRYNTCASAFAGSRSDYPEKTEVYPGPAHCYYDIWVASTWNAYRTYRIFAQAIVLNCIEWLRPTTWGDANTFQYYSTTRILQQMVDDTCASVPFHLGISSSTAAEISFFVHSKKDFSILLDKSDLFKRQRGFHALGGYYLVWPLFVAASVSCIPEIQKRWLRGRMTYIGARYGLNQATALAALGTHTANWYYEEMMSVTDFTRQPKNRSSIL